MTEVSQQLWRAVVDPPLNQANSVHLFAVKSVRTSVPLTVAVPCQGPVFQCALTVKGLPGRNEAGTSKMHPDFSTRPVRDVVPDTN